MRFMQRFHLHPFLIGIFPVLSLYAHNQSQLEPNAPWRSLAVVIGGTISVFAILYLWFRDWGKAGFVTSYMSLLFFLYNPAREILHNVHTSNFNLGWNRYFLPLWCLVLIWGVWVILKKIPPRDTTIQLFNFIALSTLVLPIVSIVSYSISHPSANVIQPIVDFTQRNNAANGNRPDIYYIVLDMYGRSDTIEKEFGFDNSSFLEELRRQGFYVAACSTSNYSHTVMSMASALNMNFLPALGNEFVPGNKDHSRAATLIRNSAVRQYLHEYGYVFVSYASFFPYIDIPDSDIYIKIPERNDNIQPFELLLIGQTPLKIALDKIAAKTAESETIRLFGKNYDRTVFILEDLPQLPTKVKSPKFVYAHLFIPHPPYVFGPNGEYVGNDERLNGGPYRDPVDEAAYHEGYTNHLRYLNSVLPQILNQIISQSETEPIIIIQGDHGFWGDADKRLPILNAYYLPEKDVSGLLYPTITPVNSFRVILNTYFNGEFDLLPDENYPTVNQKDYYDVQRLAQDAIECKPK